MNWLMFFCGAGCGAFVSVVGIILAIHTGKKSASNVAERSLAALEERNGLEREANHYYEQITNILEAWQRR